MRNRRRGTVVAAAVAATLLVPTTAAAAPKNCLAQVIAAEQDIFGTSWGREEVSFLARNPSAFNDARHLGDVVHFFLRADECPLP